MYSHRLLPLAVLVQIASSLPAWNSIFEARAAEPALYAGSDQCPANLPPYGSFEFPHLIIPVSCLNPQTTYPNTLHPVITAGDIASIFNFDIPANTTTCHCTLEFLFPNQNQLTTSHFDFSGPGTFTFDADVPGPNSYAVDGMTCYNNAPPRGAKATATKTITMQPGNAYTIFSGPCVPGRGSVTVSGLDSNFTWFEDWNPCPLGLYATYTEHPAVP